MDSSQFQWAVVVFGIILGLSITRLLSSAVSVFLSRKAAPPDWIALSWATCIFFLQLELWWSIADLRLIVHQWTFFLFLLFAFSPLLLFFAAAIILPGHDLCSGESQRKLFEQHGRWALIALSTYYAESLFETAYFWRASLLETWAMLNVLLIALPIAAFFSSRRVHAYIAALSLILTICFVFADILVPTPD